MKLPNAMVLNACRVLSCLCVFSAQILFAQTVTLSISESEIEEHDRSSATITATIADALETELQISLQSVGAAKLGADFDLDSSTITIQPGETEATSTLTPIRDWDREGDEIAEIQIASPDGDGNVASSRVATITILDSFEVTDGDSDGDSIAPVTGADLFPYPSLVGGANSVTVTIVVYNLGSQISRPGALAILLFQYPNVYQGRHILRYDVPLPSIQPFPRSYRYQREIFLDELNPSSNFIGLIRASMLPENTNELNESNDVGVFGFAIDENNHPLVSCQTPQRANTEGLADPLFEHQWHLKNTGQPSFAVLEGTEGADFRMDATMSSNYVGDRVVVAVVDDGLEICHPDLATNVDIGKSVNFLADPSSSVHWHGSRPTDPFNPESTGDHGTSVAGVIAALANNGKGGRGVAPKARLRGFNFLQNPSFDNLITSIGGADPAQNDIDVVNMSYGALLASDYHPATYDIFSWGTRFLRQGKGALFVKAAGNFFQRCSALAHEIHPEIGCTSPSSDYTNNVPFVLVVGSFNAQDGKASYSGVSSTVWISAPAGEEGTQSAAIITSDQHSADRGYGTVYRDPLWLRINQSHNPNGDYMSIFNGTSAASAGISGAIAVLLDVEPQLTFRDVKHILAKTARKIQPDQPRVRVAIGEIPYVLQHAWTTNAAGYHFHNWYGFGAINLDEAVAMAENFDLQKLGTFAVSDWIGMDTEFDEEAGQIPDVNGGGFKDTLDVNVPLNFLQCGEEGQDRHCITEDLPDAAELNIEGVQLRLTLSHARASDLGITLISPNGTESVLNPVFNNSNVRAITGDEELHLLSNAFYGENPAGEWQIQIVDVLEGSEGRVVSWDLKFFVGQHLPDDPIEDE